MSFLFSVKSVLPLVALFTLSEDRLAEMGQFLTQNELITLSLLPLGVSADLHLHNLVAEPCDVVIKGAHLIQSEVIHLPLCEHDFLLHVHILNNLIIPRVF